MNPRAGSALWLLRHEIRLFVFNAGAKSKKGVARRGLSTASIGVWLFVALGMHALAFGILRPLGGAAPEPAPWLSMALTGLFAAAVTMMMSTGLRSSVEALFSRGDLDLLLSSPLPSRAIFTVRLGGIVLAIASIYLFFLAPFAHVGLLLGQFRWLAIYPVIAGMAMLTASVSMLVTLALVRSMGVRRTKVVAQVLGALSGALFFLLSQLYSNALRGVKEAALARFGPLLEPGQLLGPDSIAWLPGHALLGSPGPVLLLSTAGVAAFFLTVHFTHRFFAHGAQQAVSAVRHAPAPAGALRFRFGRSLAHAVIVKEWRLIARDPHLISQVLMQLLYLLPLCALLFVKGGAALPMIGSGLVFVCASLAGSLAWIVIAAEDAPDLLLAAPCSQATIRSAKLAAVAIPPLALVLPPLAWVALTAPLAALLTAATVGAAVSSGALVSMWLGRPAPRKQFGARGKSNFLGNAFELASGFCWAGITYLLLMGTSKTPWSALMLAGAGVVGIGAMLVLGLAWLWRRKPA